MGEAPQGSSASVRRWRLLIPPLGALLVLWFVAPVLAEPLRFELHDLTLIDGKVEFHVLGGGSAVAVEGLPLGTERFSPGGTTSYAVYADLEAIRPGKYNAQYQYELIAVPRADAAGARRFVALGYPAGNFMDALADVRFEVHKGRVIETGTIRLPVFSFSGPHLLGCESHLPLEQISLGRPLDIPLRLTNLVEGLPIRIRTVDPPTSEGAGWSDLAFAHEGRVGSEHGFEIPPGGLSEGALRVVGQPAPLAALRGGFFPVAPGKPHDRIAFSIHYASRGGVERPMRVEIPVRFVPSPLALVLALAAGTLLGSLAALALGGNTARTWPRALVSALATALIAWGLAMVLMVADSRFRLLGFELDPFQLLPTALIGAVFGLGGFRTFRFFQHLGPGGPAGPGGQAAAPGGG